MTLHDPYLVATPSQRLAAAAHLHRMTRLSPKAFIEPMVSVFNPPAVDLANCARPIPDSAIAEATRLASIVWTPQFRTTAILRAVLTYYPEVTMQDLKSSRRTHDVVIPRQLAMYLVKELTGFSFPQIGNLFGKRDHTTALHAYRKIEAMLLTDPVMAAVADDIKKMMDVD